MARASCNVGKAMSSLEQLIEEINFQRAKEMRQLLKDDTGFVMVHGTAYWTDLFVRHFIFEEECNAQESDDLLFFVRKRHLKQASKYIPRFETSIDVFRRDSKRLPIGDPEIDWEETVYTNLIIHQFHYYVTMAICTRTSPRELQILKRHTERVWASPSRRLMSDKGTAEEITYPNICFMLDSFDEIFGDILVRDGEMVSVELLARDRSGAVQGVIFLGSVRYEALRRIYDARASAGSRMAHRMSFGLFSTPSARRMEFVRVRGPMGKGHAEMAVTKPPGATCETPVSEPGFTLTDQTADSDAEDESDDVPFQRRHQRRSSDPSATLNAFMYSSLRNRPRDVGRARSEAEGLDAGSSACAEIEAGDLRDDSSESVSAPSFSTRHEQDAITIRPSAAGDGRIGAGADGTSGDGRDGADGTAGDSRQQTTASSRPAATPGMLYRQMYRQSCQLPPPAADPRKPAGACGQENPGVLETKGDSACGRELKPGALGIDEKGVCSPLAGVEEGVSSSMSGGETPAGKEGSVGSSTADRPCHCARTSSGIVAHYRCPHQMRYLQQRKLDDGAYNPIWTMRGFSQTFHFWKESKRSASVPLNAFLTYIMLPYNTIINDLITKSSRQDPILTF